MDRVYTLEKLSMGDVGPVRIVQLYADGFEQLTLQEKIFIYYLTQAAVAGRDIAIDQRHKDGLTVRSLLEAVLTHPAGTPEAVTEKIRLYAKLFWVNNGFHDDITSRKFVPECTFAEFSDAVRRAVSAGAVIDGAGEASLDDILSRIERVIFDPGTDPIRTNKTPGEDIISGSANNLYEGTTFDEVDAWAKSGGEHYPLNSKVVKRNGVLEEEVYRTGTRHIGGTIPAGKYAADLESVIDYLARARPYAASPQQQESIDKLITFYRTGAPEAWRAFTISWLADTEVRVDFIHGFIEVYLDARGMKGQYEAIINFADPVLTETVQKIGSSARYFEERMPWSDLYKKADVQPLKASVINVVVETGDAGPVSAIGINLPNEEDIRERFGSKSVSLNNIVDAYEKSGGRDIAREFSFDDAEYERFLRFGRTADNLHTALHEVLGHGSGKMDPSVTGDPHTLLPGYYSTLEEARADLVALWHIWDDRLKEFGAVDRDNETARAMYDKEVRNALLVQLQRVPKGTDQLEEDHMKNRQLIAAWLMDNTDAIEKTVRDGKTFVRVRDYAAMREGVGILLSEVMRIKATGDLASARRLIDRYGLKIDTALRDEVLERMAHLDRAVYTGFVMPKLEPVHDGGRRIKDVTVSYPLDLERQMLEYSAFTRMEKAKRRGLF